MAKKTLTQHEKLDIIIGQNSSLLKNQEMILAKLEQLLPPCKVTFGDGKPPAPGAGVIGNPAPDEPAIPPTLEEIAPDKPYRREIEECNGVANYISRIKARVPNYVGDLAVYTEGELKFMADYPRLFVAA